MRKNTLIALTAMFIVGSSVNTMAQNTKAEINKAGSAATKEAAKDASTRTSVPSKVVVKSENAILQDAPVDRKTDGKMESGVSKEAQRATPAIERSSEKPASSATKEAPQVKGTATKTTLRLEQTPKEAPIVEPSAKKKAETTAVKVADEVKTETVKVAEKEALKAVDKTVDTGRSKKDNTPK